MSKSSLLFHRNINNKIKDIGNQYQELTDLGEKSKLLFLMQELSDFVDIFNPDSTDGKPTRLKHDPEQLTDKQLYKVTIALTNHPTYSLGHEATEVILDMKLAIINGDMNEVNRKIDEFLKIDEVTSKRSTDQSYYVINNYAKIAWKTYDLLSDDAKKYISLEDWLNDADGNPNKTCKALDDSLVHSNTLFRDLVVEDLEKIAEKTSVGRAGITKLIEYLKDFEISPDKFLSSKKVNSKIRNIISEGGLNQNVSDKLNHLMEKVGNFESFVTKPQMRQEGAIFERGYNLLKQRFSEFGVTADKISNYKLEIANNGDIKATGATGNTMVLFKAKEYEQKKDEDGKPLPLNKKNNEIPIDNIAKLLKLAKHKELPIKKFIMSEFKGSKEMAATLRLFEAAGIDTKKIGLYPLYEEIQNYADMKVFSRILKQGTKEGNDLTDDEKLIKKYIDETGAVRIMYAASDTSKRGGVMSYSKMLHEIKELAEAIAEYNKEKPDGEKIKLSFFWGGGPDPARGGEINFIREVKSIVGQRGVPLEFTFTEQGQQVVRNSDPVNMASSFETYAGEYLYHSSRNIDPESVHIKKNNADIWDRFGEIFAVLGGDLSSGNYNSQYQKYSKEELTTNNEALSLANALAGLANTSDRPSKREESEPGTPFLEFMRAIGYDHGARLIGFNNTVLGHKEKLETFFNKFDKGGEQEFTDQLKNLYQNSTTYHAQVNTIGAIIGLTDLEFLQKVADTLIKADPEKFKDVQRFVDSVKQETIALAKFAAISTGEAEPDTDRYEAYKALKEKHSKHLRPEMVKMAQDNMLELIGQIASGDKQVESLKSEKAVVAAFLHTVRPEAKLAPTLEKKKEKLNDFEDLKNREKGGIT